MDRADKPLALTLGDPAGIGPDITLLAFTARRALAIPPFVLIGDPGVLAERARMMDLAVRIEPIGDTTAAPSVFTQALTGAAGSRCRRSGCGPTERLPRRLRSAIDRTRGRVWSVTAPQARWLPVRSARRCLLAPVSAFLATPNFSPRSPRLDAPDAGDDAGRRRSEGRAGDHPYSAEGRDGRAHHSPHRQDPRDQRARSLRRYFGVARPRIAVTGLNPHAGEDGAMGREEIEIIVPAIEAARDQGLDVTGPHPADTLFHAEARKAYDVAIGMYHDQALIPVKTLAFDTGVNVTLGLPFVRTSPDHGTAFALAGTGKASPRSLIEALRLADAMQRNAGERLEHA